MFEGPIAKLARANDHLLQLNGFIQGFASESYRIDAHPDFWETGVSLGEIVVYAEAVHEPHVDVWGPVIGDIVHGLRSALDQVVWELSVAFDPTGPPPDPIPRGSPWRRVAFPVRANERDWNFAATRSLWAIDPDLQPSFAALQPFATNSASPDREPLAVLEELWNIDKHRHPHLVNATAELHEVPTVNPFPENYDLPAIGTFEVVSRRPPGTLRGRAEVGRVRHVSIEGGILAMSVPQLHMDPRLLIHVAFAEGAPAFGQEVLVLLDEISTSVAHVVEAFLQIAD